MEKSEHRVTFGKRRSALDMRIGMMGAMRASNRAGDEELYLPVAAVLNVLTGCDCANQTEQNDFEVLQGWSRRISYWLLCLKLRFYSLSCVVNIFALPDGWEEGACRAAAPAGRGYRGIFYFHRTWVPEPWRLWLVRLSQSTPPHLSHPVKLQS